MSINYTPGVNWNRKSREIYKNEDYLPKLLLSML